MTVSSQIPKIAHPDNCVIAKGEVAKREEQVRGQKEEFVSFELLHKPLVARKKIKKQRSTTKRFSEKFYGLLKSRLGKLVDQKKEIYIQTGDEKSHKINTLTLEAWINWLTKQNSPPANVRQLLSQLCICRIEDPEYHGETFEEFHTKERLNSLMNNLSVGGFAELRVAHILDGIMRWSKTDQVSLFEGYSLKDYRVFKQGSIEDHQQKDISIDLESQEDHHIKRAYLQVKAGNLSRNQKQVFNIPGKLGSRRTKGLRPVLVDNAAISRRDILQTKVTNSINLIARSNGAHSHIIKKALNV